MHMLSAGAIKFTFAVLTKLVWIGSPFNLRNSVKCEQKNEILFHTSTETLFSPIFHSLPDYSCKSSKQKIAIFTQSIEKFNLKFKIRKTNIIFI